MSGHAGVSTIVDINVDTNVGATCVYRVDQSPWHSWLKDKTAPTDGLQGPAAQQHWSCLWLGFGGAAVQGNPERDRWRGSPSYFLASRTPIGPLQPRINPPPIGIIIMFVFVGRWTINIPCGF